MPEQRKKTTSTKKNAKDSSASKKVLHVAIIGLLTIAVGWLVLANPVLNHLDKQRFADAEVFLRDIYETEIAPLSEPDREETLNSCRYTSSKLGDGTLFCTTRLYITFNNANEDLKNELIEATHENIIDNPTQNSLNKKDVSGVINYDGKIECIASTEYNEISKQLDIKLICSGEARAEHFPLES